MIALSGYDCDSEPGVKSGESLPEPTEGTLLSGSCVPPFVLFRRRLAAHLRRWLPLPQRCPDSLFHRLQLFFLAQSSRPFTHAPILEPIPHSHSIVPGGFDVMS